MTKLSCKSCGAKLEFTEDVDRFSCAHCGAEWIVNRGGGIVSLKAVEADIHAISSDTAVLASAEKLKVLEEHQRGLSKSRAHLDAEMSAPGTVLAESRTRLNAAAVAVVGVLLYMACVIEGGVSLFFLMLMIVVLGYKFAEKILMGKEKAGREERLLPELRQLDAQIQDYQQRIANVKKVVLAMASR